MPHTPHPALTDSVRLHALHSLGLLGGPVARAYGRLTRLAARLLRAPVALISLVDADRQFFLSSHGLAEPWASRGESPLSHSFCQHVVADRAPFIVADARTHPRVADNRAVDEMGVIAYIGIPLTTPEGAVLGALCVIDHQPRSWEAEDLDTLTDLAAAVMTEISLHQSEAAIQASERRRQAAADQQRRARLEAAHAAERIDRLYTLTATLTQALTPQQVAEAVTAQAVAALGAYAGMLITRSVDGSALRLAHAIGHPPAALALWGSLPLDAALPPAEVLRCGKPIWLPSREELQRRYPAICLGPDSPTQALAAIPLCLGGAAVAVIVLSFATPQPFDEDDRTLLWFLAEQCAQALDRAQALGQAEEEQIERRRAEEALRRQTELYEHLLRAQSDLGEGVLMIEGEQIVFINDAATAITGRAREDLVSLPSFLSLLTPESRAALLARTAAAGAACTCHHTDLAISHTSGRRVEIELAAINMRVDGAEPWIVLVRDITARRQAEAALRRSERLLDAIVEHIPHMLVLKDARDLRFVRFNQAGERLIGLARESLVGKSDADIFPPEQAALAAASDREVLSGAQVVDIPEEQLLSRDLGRRWLHTRKIPIGTTGGPPDYLLTISEDITARKQAEAVQQALDRQLQETQKLESLGLLAGGVAHDFNNMLVAVLGNAELALLDLEPEHPARPSVEQLMLASRRAAELTSQLLAYSGRGRFVVGPLDLNALVSEMAGLLRAAIPRTITVETALEPGLPPIEADATQLRQVVMNLVINAGEALGGGSGRVSVRTGLRLVDRAWLADCYLGADLSVGPYVALEVSDHGVGMDEATLRRIFEPFFSTKRPGRGLGLAAVLGIVRAHGGTLHLRSAPGLGTTITALLPPGVAAAPMARDEPPPAAEAHPRAQATLLVIDDEESVRLVTVRMLARLGYTVLNVASGEEGVALCAAQPDLGGVLLDLTMPGLSGEQTFRRLRAERADLPVVIISGYSEQEVRSRVGHDAGVAVVQKPFSSALLQEALSGVLQPLATAP